MEKQKGKRYKQSYRIRVSSMLPGPLWDELEEMMRRHELKPGPLVAQLALRGLMEYRRDGRLGTPQDLGLPDCDADETSPPESACVGRARTAVSGNS